MKQPLIALALLLGLVASIGLGVRATRRHSNHGPVYRVATVVSGLRRDPEVWLYHTLLVRGVARATPCLLFATGTVCAAPRFMLGDPAPASAWLGLTWQGGDPVLSFLRTIPLVGTFVPAPQVIQWDVVAVYQVQLRIERPCSVSCYEAVLQDATP